MRRLAPQVGCELEFHLLAKAPDRAKAETITALDASRYCHSSQVDAAMDGQPGHRSVMTKVQRDAESS